MVSNGRRAPCLLSPGALISGFPTELRKTLSLGSGCVGSGRVAPVEVAAAVGKDEVGGSSGLKWAGGWPAEPVWPGPALGVPLAGVVGNPTSTLERAVGNLISSRGPAVDMDTAAGNGEVMSTPSSPWESHGSVGSASESASGVSGVGVPGWAVQG